MAETVEDRERDPDGKFAPKPDKQTKRKGRAARLPKRGPGRPKGSKNKATREWKEFALMISKDPEVQEALKARILARPELLLRLAEHAVGRPKETTEVEFDGSLTVTWED